MENTSSPRLTELPRGSATLIGAGFPDWLRGAELEQLLSSAVVHLAASTSQVCSDAFAIGRPVKETTLQNVEDDYAHCRKAFHPNTQSERNMYASQLFIREGCR